MNAPFKPMLACKQLTTMSFDEYVEAISEKLPLIYQPKIDGIRCIIDRDGDPRSRTWKLISNTFVRNELKKLKLPFGFDGELVVINENREILPFNTISSEIMSQEGEPNFRFVVFDWYQEIATNSAFSFRFELLTDYIISMVLPDVLLIGGQSIYTKEQLQQVIADNSHNEGIILRSPNAPYKQGRSTLKEAALVALKFYDQEEAYIVGFKEEQENGNTVTQDAFNLTERSSHKDNKHGKERLGAFTVQDKKTGVIFDVGTGFSALDRQLYWKDRMGLEGKLITYKFHKNRSLKNKPIAPVFIGFRDESDT